MACPFLQHVQPDASPSGCPFGKAPTESSATPAAKCPLGFGSAGSALPSPLHCTQCRGLLHDCVRVEACGHKLCRFCVEPFVNFGCPICGVDIDALKPDHETNGLVEKFLDIHAGNPALWTKMAGVPPSQDTSKAGFLLLLGMQSYSGGNLAAALSRLQACKRELMLQAASGGPASTDDSLAAACVKAGAVCGTLADCYKQMAQRAPAVRPPPAPHAPTPPQQQVQQQWQEQEPQREQPQQQEQQQQEQHASAGSVECGTSAGAAGTRGCPFHRPAAAPSTAPSTAASTAPSTAPSTAAATRCKEATCTDGRAASSTAAAAAAGHEPPDGAAARQAAAAGCPHMQQQQQQHQVVASCPRSDAAREGGLEEGGGPPVESAEQLLDHAADLYREGIELLGPHAGTDLEAVHALAVTHNKLGDLQYVRGDVQGARQCYVRGLSARQAALDAAGGPAGGAEGESLALDVAVSSIKVADASKALGDRMAVAKFCSKARQLLLRVQAGQAASGGGAAAAKCQQLMELLDSGLSAS